MTEPQKLRLIFAGTPEFAATHLESLINSPHQIIGVYTQPDRPAGRGRKLQPSPVKQCALAHHIDVFQPTSLKTEQQQRHLAELQADLMVVVAYGLILPQAVLDAPRYGCINVHASLLPRWRGAAPIQRAIEAGDAQTGITIMQMDAGLDTGDMMASVPCPVDELATAAELHDRLAELGPPLLLQVLEQLHHYRNKAQAQGEQGGCYARKLTKAEAQIDWHQDATVLARQIRAFNPFPCSYTTVANQRLKIHRAIASDTNHLQTEVTAGTIVNLTENGIEVACGRGVLQITQLQLAGGKVLDAGAMLNARRQQFSTGVQLGTD